MPITDIQIQSYVEEDHPKLIEELNLLTNEELGKWLETREAILRFLVDDDESAVITIN